MNVPWSTVLSIALITGAALAELNLARALLREWREGLKQTHRKRSPSKAQNMQQVEQHPLRAFIAAGLILAPCLAITAAHGQSAPAQPADAAKPAEPADKPAAESTNPFSLQLNLDFTSAYFFRGFLQENQGLIVQPAAKLTFNAYNKSDVKIDAFVSTWNSIHSEKTGSPRSEWMESWYECDLLGGATVTLGKWSFTGQYIFYTSPNDAYDMIQELDISAGFDDSDALGKWAMHPYALVGIETSSFATDGVNPGSYLELGIAPGFSFDVEKTPVAISFPVTVGLSLHNYYQNAAGDDETFGFASVGAKASFPLPLSDKYGKWALNASVVAQLLGNHAAAFNNGANGAFLGTIGVQLDF